VIRTNKHPVATRTTRKEWRWAKIAKWVDTQRIKVSATDLERISRWKVRRLSKRAPWSIRRGYGLWTGRIVSWGDPSRTIWGLRRDRALRIPFLVQARYNILNDFNLKLANKVCNTVR